MVTKTLLGLAVNEETRIFSPSDYQTLQSTRTRLKRSKEYSDYEWSIKLGGGKVVVRRNK